MQPERKRRRYSSPDRVERAHATAREILRAAEGLFAAQGYAAVTMREIASAAGVAPATVYLHYAGKGAIVRALANAITGASDLSVERVEGADSVDGQLRTAVAILRQLNERAWVVAGILRTHSAGDPELIALALEWQQRHLDAVTRGVAAIAKVGRLRRGVSPEQAADILFAVAGTDVYRALVRERGWSGDQYAAWLMEFIEDHLLGDPAN